VGLARAEVSLLGPEAQDAGRARRAACGGAPCRQNKVGVNMYLAEQPGWILCKIVIAAPPHLFFLNALFSGCLTNF